jgi:hypothetical protein
METVSWIAGGLYPPLGTADLGGALEVPLGWGPCLGCQTQCSCVAAPADPRLLVLTAAWLQGCSCPEVSRG